MLCFSSRPESLCYFLVCTESAEQWLLLTCSFLEGGVGYAQGNSFVLQVSKQVSSLLDHTCPQLGSDLDSKFTLLVLERWIT